MIFVVIVVDYVVIGFVHVVAVVTGVVVVSVVFVAAYNMAMIYVDCYAVYVGNRIAVWRCCCR